MLLIHDSCRMTDGRSENGHGMMIVRERRIIARRDETSNAIGDDDRRVRQDNIVDVRHEKNTGIIVVHDENYFSLM